MVLRKEQCAEWRKGTSAEMLQSGLDENWWADSLECYTNLRNIQDLLSDGKTPCERRFGMLFNGPVIPFGPMVTLSLRRTYRDYINLVQKSRQVYSSFMYCTRWESGKETLVADIEELEKMDASEIHAEKPNAKEVSTRVSGEKFKIPNRRWNSQTIWKRSGSENIHLDTGQKAQTEKIKEIFKGNQTGHLQFHFKTHRRMMVKPEMIFGTFEGTTFTVITLNRESNCTCPGKHHSQFHWNISTLPERQILPWIFWHVDGDREWSDTWTGFTRFSLLNERNHQMGPDGRGETDKKTNDFEASHFVARDLERYDRCIQT